MPLRLILLLSLATGLRAEVVEYRIQPAPGDRFALEVYKTGLLSGKKHLFLFERYTGNLLYDPDSPRNSRVEVRIEGVSAVCQDTWVKPKDLKKILDTALHEMMDVEKHPELSFSSTGVLPKGEDQSDVQGLLTIRGIAKPASVSVTTKRLKDDAFSFNGTARVKLKDYGLKPPSAALGAVGTKNEMTVSFVLTARRIKAKQ